MDKRKLPEISFTDPTKMSKENIYGSSPITSFLLSLISCSESGFCCGDDPSDDHEPYVPRKIEIASRQRHNQKGLGRVAEKGNRQNLHEIDGGRTNSPIFEHESEKNTLKKKLELLPEMSDSSRILSEDFRRVLYLALPTLVHGCQWMLLYSTWKHGISLLTLYRKSAHLSGPGLLVAMDNKGAVFGGLLTCPLKPTSRAKYQGTNETFVFTNVSGKPKLFHPTGVNQYFFLCSNDALSFGGGGGFALRLNGDLLQGTSYTSETFGNSCLAKSGEFTLNHVELWGFAHASKYAPTQNYYKGHIVV